MAVVGNHRTYETDEGTTHVSVRPETLQVIDASTHDLWVRAVATHTRERLAAFEAGDSPYGEPARERYGAEVSGIEAAVTVVAADLDGDGDGVSAGEAGDDEYPCPDCDRPFESKHGPATHRCEQHTAADTEAD